MRFTPTEDFFSDETRSQYVVGQTYTLRPGNDKLARLLNDWLEEGLVRLMTAEEVAASSGSATGAGAVT